MFGFSMGEILLLAAIALIAIGPRQLPEVARTIGRLLNELKRATADFQKAFFDLQGETDKSIDNFRQSVERSLAPPSAPPAPAALPPTPTGEGDKKPAEEAEQMSFDLNKKGP